MSSTCRPRGRKGAGQVDLHQCAVDQVLELCAAELRRGPSRAGTRRLGHLGQGHTALGAAGAEPRILIEQAGAAARAVEEVLVQLNPEVAQRVGRVVGVGDALFAGDLCATVSSEARMT